MGALSCLKENEPFVGAKRPSSGKETEEEEKKDSMISKYKKIQMKAQTASRAPACLLPQSAAASTMAGWKLEVWKDTVAAAQFESNLITKCAATAIFTRPSKA